MADDDVKNNEGRDKSGVHNAIPLFVKNPVLKYFNSTGEFPETYEQLKENDPASPMPKPDTIYKYGGLENVVEAVKAELKEQETYRIQHSEDETDPRREQDTEIDPFKRRETSYDQQRSPGVRIELQEGMEHSVPHQIGSALDELRRDYSGLQVIDRSKDDDSAEILEEEKGFKRPLGEIATFNGTGKPSRVDEPVETETAAYSHDDHEEEPVDAPVEEAVEEAEVHEVTAEDIEEVTAENIEEVLAEEEAEEQKSVIVSPDMDPERDIATRPEVPSEYHKDDIQKRVPTMTYSEPMSSGKKWGVIGTVTAALLIGGYFLLDVFKSDKKEEPIKKEEAVVKTVDQDDLKNRQYEKGLVDDLLKKKREERQTFEEVKEKKHKKETLADAEEAKPELETLEQRCVASAYTQIKGKVEKDHPLSKASKYNLSGDGKDKISAQGLINTAYWYGTRKFGKRSQRWDGGYGTDEQFQMAKRWLAGYGIDIHDLLKKRDAEISPSMIDADKMTSTAGNDACSQYRNKKDKSGHNMHDLQESQDKERLASADSAYNCSAAPAYDHPAREVQATACVEETYLESVLDQRSELGISIERITRKGKDGNQKTDFRYRHKMREGVAGTWVSRSYVEEAVAVLHEYDTISASENDADRMRSLEIVSKYFTKESAEHACRG